MKRLQKATNDNEKGKFWIANSPLHIVGARKLRLTVFFNLKPSCRTISIRLPESLLGAIKVLLRKKDTPYQSTLEMLLAEIVRDELMTSKRRAAAG